MSTAGVNHHIAERLLTHKIGGLRGIYDRYEYLSEKRDALAKLAKLIGEIVKMKLGGLEVDLLVKPLLRYFFNGTDR
jgi:hypothetical protein